MDSKNIKQYKSSLIPNKPENLDLNGASQFRMPSVGLVGVLIIAFVVLKVFIYIKDNYREGK
jgi:hypothetical protein